MAPEQRRLAAPPLPYAGRERRHADGCPDAEGRRVDIELHTSRKPLVRGSSPARADAPAPEPGPVWTGPRADPAKLTRFHPPITAIRWGAVAVSSVLAAAPGDAWPMSYLLALLAHATYAGWRTLRPIRVRGDNRDLLEVTFEIALATGVMVLTGHWASPFAFSLISAVGVAAFVLGFGSALRFTAVAVATVALASASQADVATDEALRASTRWAVELVIVAAIAGYARRFSGDVEARHSLALDQVGRLTEANQLLSSLHQVAQTLPASLDIEEVLDGMVERLRSFWDIEALAVLVPDETSERWLCVRQAGADLPRLADLDQLPAPLRHAATTPTTLAHPTFDRRGAGSGLSSTAGSGLYAPLHARGQLVGLLAVEHADPGHFGETDLGLLDGFTESAALALDNARWFARLRAVGANAERNRIARELHDRVGQSLASLGFELDLLSRHRRDDELRPGIERLRDDLRGAVVEIRNTLSDLRTEVTASRGLVEALAAFATRVGDRGGAEVVLEAPAQPPRLPLLQEQEMWRIAQEAVTNAERHAHATRITVRWWSDGAAACLEVDDDGVGFDTEAAASAGSYGLLGMRERAAAIRARLDVVSARGRGTRVRCSLTGR